jgi:hypothetical protein
MVKNVAVGLWFVSLFCAPPLAACMHTPVDYKFSVRETTQEALLYHDGVNAHLIIRTGLQSTGALPKTLAWVLPLSALPVHYQEEDEGLFRQLYEAFVRHYKSAKRQDPLAQGLQGGIKVHETLQVGSYEVSPIEILSDGAGGELNQWLSAHGFGTMPVERQRYYLHKGAAFLALRLSGLQGTIVGVKPLHIVYPADKASLPLKFSFRPFDVRLDAKTFQAYRLYGQGSIDLSKGGLPELVKALGPVHGYVSKFQGFGFNAPQDLSSSVESLPGDPSIPAGTVQP